MLKSILSWLGWIDIYIFLLCTNTIKLKSEILIGRMVERLHTSVTGRTQARASKASESKPQNILPKEGRALISISIFPRQFNILSIKQLNPRYGMSV